LLHCGRGVDDRLHQAVTSLAIALGLLGGLCVEQLPFGRAGDDVQEQPLASAQHQGLARYGALEQRYFVGGELKASVATRRAPLSIASKTWVELL